MEWNADYTNMMVSGSDSDGGFTDASGGTVEVAVADAWAWA